MHKLLASLALLITLVGCATTGTSTAVNPDPNHTHADFAVFINGQQVDFSAAKYMTDPVASSTSRLPFVPTALAHGEAADGTSPGHDYLHLHDGVGTVIHRHQPGLTLADFFASIDWTWRDGCFQTDEGDEVCESDTAHWQMFVNDVERVPFDLVYDFADLDRILLTYGADPADIPAQLDAVTDDACVSSQTCPERGPAPAENCIADPDIPCVIPTPAT